MRPGFLEIIAIYLTKPNTPAEAVERAAEEVKKLPLLQDGAMVVHVGHYPEGPLDRRSFNFHIRILKNGARDFDSILAQLSLDILRLESTVNFPLLFENHEIVRFHSEPIGSNLELEHEIGAFLITIIKYNEYDFYEFEETKKEAKEILRSIPSRFPDLVKQITFGDNNMLDFSGLFPQPIADWCTYSLGVVMGFTSIYHLDEFTSIEPTSASKYWELFFSKVVPEQVTENYKMTSLLSL